MHNKIFFTNILRCLDEKGMTKQELSEKADISISFISDLTTGKANPSLKVMEQIADALGVALTSLLEDSDLDAQALDELKGSAALSGVPRGYKRVSVILPGDQALIVEGWAADARRRLAKREKN